MIWGLLPVLVARTHGTKFQFVSTGMISRAIRDDSIRCSICNFHVDLVLRNNFCRETRLNWPSGTCSSPSSDFAANQRQHPCTHLDHVPREDQ